LTLSEIDLGVLVLKASARYALGDVSLAKTSADTRPNFEERNNIIVDGKNSKGLLKSFA